MNECMYVWIIYHNNEWMNEWMNEWIIYHNNEWIWNEHEMNFF